MFQDLIACSNIARGILLRLDTTSILQLRCVDTKWRKEADVLISSRVTAILRKFLSNPAQRMRDLCALGCVVSGSAIVAMLECDNWTKHTLRDLDIYVPEDKLKRVVRILKQTGDYKVLKKKEVAQRDEDDDASYYDVTGDTGICSVTKLALRRVPDSRIELIAVSCAPAQAIQRFHSTVVMNELVYDGLTCHYPRETLAYRNIACHRNDKELELIAGKWLHRGYTPVYGHLAANNKPLSLAIRIRE